MNKCVVVSLFQVMVSGTAAYIRASQVARINKELAEFREDAHPHVKEWTKVTEKEHIYTVKLIVDAIPYNQRQYTVRMELDGEYPYKPPVVKFVNKMYHPNIDSESGDICIPILSYDNWKPATTLQAVVYSVIQMFYEPDLSRPIELEAAEEYIKNRALFIQKATDCVLKNGDKPKV